VQALIAQGYNGGAWTGNGITSSSAVAAAGSAHKTAIGFREADTIGNFGGESVDTTAVLVRYTYSGDANLDATVDTIDFNNLASNFGGNGKTWSQGDFNFDTTVDTVDFNLLASNFGQTLAGPAAGLGSVVPEPAAAGVALLGLMVGNVLCRRQRRGG
jgi:hypothetical protein